jgi:hypothetical protein
MDALTTKQRDQMYDEIAELVIRYGKNAIARRMIKAYVTELKKVETSKELTSMAFVLTSLAYLLEITFPTK